MALAIALCLGAAPLQAEIPKVEAVKADVLGGAWTFSVTLSHPDTGWDHYADGWEILAPDGTKLGYRELVHPHVNEQPFTRSLSGVAIPEGTPYVTIRAHCKVDGWSKTPFKVKLPK